MFLDTKNAASDEKPEVMDITNDSDQNVRFKFVLMFIIK